MRIACTAKRTECCFDGETKHPVGGNVGDNAVQILRKKHAIIIGFVSALILLLGGLIWWDLALFEMRGYDVVGLVRPDFPGQRAMTVLRMIAEYSETHMEQSSGKRPSAVTIAEAISEVGLSDEQPYAEFGLYLLESTKPRQVYLYREKALHSWTEIAEITAMLFGTPRQEGLVGVITACVQATREGPKGTYLPYIEFPSGHMKDFGEDAYKEWAVQMEFDGGQLLAFYIASDTPPIPGCLAITFVGDRKRDRFYYPKTIIPTLNTIYPNAQVPPAFVLRNGEE